MASLMERAPEDSRSSAEMLLDATSALMTERNTVDITFADISAKSQLNSALIRYHFGSKSGLFRALLERDAAEAVAQLERLIRADIPAEDKLRHHIYGILKVYSRYPYMNRLVAALAVGDDPALCRFVSERFTLPLVGAQKAILEQGYAEGAFRRVDPMLFYFSLVGACDHLFNGRAALRFAFGVADVDDLLRRHYAQHLIDLLLKSIRRDIAACKTTDSRPDF